jgi:deoxyribodipyrimidine photolyase-related protein
LRIEPNIMPSFNLILGDQLFSDISALPPGPILMVEDRAIATHVKYHQHKLVLTFSAMRHFAANLGPSATYHRLEDEISLPLALKRQREAGFQQIHTFEPADQFFAQSLTEWCAEYDLQLVVHPNPMFLTSAADWSTFTQQTNRRLMADFYRWQRTRLNILIDDSGGPVGGKWSYDEENRKNLPRGHVAPYVSFPPQDAITKEVIDMVGRAFPDHIGDAADFGLPVNHEEAADFLQAFLEERIDRFGEYEDAISSNQIILYHSLISPLINIGLLTPRQIVDATLARHVQRPIPLNSLEGFLRQIIGWREFVRGIHREDRWPNPDTGTRRLGPDWFRGTTGLPPLDTSINRAIRYGWCHHIERLMVLGSAMFMCDIRAAEVNNFFMEMFVDAAEWVMQPNVFGMSQFVAPAFATKPYTSGSAYLLKMSDYGKGDWCDTWDGLYWSTVDRLKDTLATNHRMIPVLRGLQKLDPARKARIFSAAHSFIEQTTLG